VMTLSRRSSSNTSTVAASSASTGFASPCNAATLARGRGVDHVVLALTPA
jgi:hypothetical protein